MINRIHLEILRKVESTGSLNNAAEKLHLSQSALSHSIKKLEQSLKIKVWKKEGRKVALTPIGKNLLDLANRVLPEIEHSEFLICQIVEGKGGNLRIGMECHPCYRWLLNVISPFLNSWPDVDVDIKQQFQFDGMTALVNHDIDLLITPDPIDKPGIIFIPVFSYELVLAFTGKHSFKSSKFIKAHQLSGERLITYPVPKERLDIFTQFLNPENIRPMQHKKIESTDIMLNMVAAGRGVTALPDWLVQQSSTLLPLKWTKLGSKGIHKNISLGIREDDSEIEYLKSFIELANNIVLN